MAEKGNVTLLAGGDIGPNIDPVDQYAELIAPVLRQADLRFGQCEKTYTERVLAKKHGYCNPRQASVWNTAGIDVVGLANNAMAHGRDVLMDTVGMFRGMGKSTIGVGRNIDEARTPAIMERNGVTIAFLGYCSVLKDGEDATHDRAGVVPMRARTYYQRGGDPTEDWQPGMPPRVHTVPYEQDLQALQDDIRTAKQHADVVVMSIHWGIHLIPKTIAEYQPVVAHAAIDAGADLILGHHPHTLKGIEVYKGKACFYSLGNLMMTAPKPLANNRWGLWWYRPDAEYAPTKSIYLYPPDSRMTMLAKAVFSRKGVERISFLPAFINPRAQPAVVTPDQSRFQDILSYVEWLSDPFATQFSVDGNEIVVDAAA